MVTQTGSVARGRPDELVMSEHESITAQWSSVQNISSSLASDETMLPGVDA